MINLFNTKNRTTKNETKAYLWKVSNGYKMSRKGKKLLGISEDASGSIGIGVMDGELIILHDNENSNGTISKNNLITNSSLVAELDSRGDKFEILAEKTVLENGLTIYKMVAETSISESEEPFMNSNDVNDDYELIEDEDNSEESDII